MKKCCIRWNFLLGGRIVLTVSHYKYKFDKIKYCPECGQAF